MEGHVDKEHDSPKRESQVALVIIIIFFFFSLYKCRIMERKDGWAFGFYLYAFLFLFFLDLFIFGRALK